MANDPDERLLARNLIEVHGGEAAIVARGNARDAALAGQPVQARSWIRVLGIIQRQLNARPVANASDPPAAKVFLAEDNRIGSLSGRPEVQRLHRKCTSLC